MAQRIGTQSISSLGHVPSHTDIPSPSLHWNVGEVMIGQVGNENALNQGLYQMLERTTANKDEVWSSTLFEVFPNPSSGRVQILKKEEMKMDLYDEKGRRLNERIPVETLKYNMDLRTYPSGTYYLIARSAKQYLQIEKIILITH